MYGAKPQNGTLVYVNGEVETMQDQFSLQKSDLKMIGIPLIPGEIPKESLLKFTKRLSILQGTLARLQPSLILILRILVTYTLSVVDYVLSAIPVQAEWVQPQRIQIKRIVCKALCIPIRTPNKMLWASLDHMGFAVPHVFTRLQCQYIKGLFLACNSRSTYTRETTKMLMLYSKPEVPPHPDWIIAQQWMAQHGISFHLPADLTECPIRIEVQHIPEGDIILMSDGSKETNDQAWTALVIDIKGVALKASFAVRCKGGSSWIAEWCGKFLNMLLIHRFEIDPKRIRGAISDNLAAMHGGEGSKPSKCIWIDAYRMAYAQFLCEHNIPEYYIPAQHNTKSNARVALWQKETDDMAKSTLQHAAEGQVPIQKHWTT